MEEEIKAMTPAGGMGRYRWWRTAEETAWDEDENEDGRRIPGEVRNSPRTGAPESRPQ